MKSVYCPDLQKVTRITPEVLASSLDTELAEYLKEAREYLLYYNWCESILEEYVGLFVNRILGIFLFRIVPTRIDVDEWIWVVVGDLPPAYLTCDQCPTPVAALDGYIGAMTEWVDAAAQGKSVADLIPVNVPATLDNADLLRKRLEFLDKNILSKYPDD